MAGIETSMLNISSGVSVFTNTSRYFSKTSLINRFWLYDLSLPSMIRRFIGSMVLELRMLEIGSGVK